MSEFVSGYCAIVGRPNAGKSTLVNLLVGAKVSIVTHKVQTTRTRVMGIAMKDQAQIVFIDTPGIFQPKRRLDRAMVGAAWMGVDEADQTVLLIDASVGLNAENQAILDGLIERKAKAVLALNKIDLVKREKLLELAATKPQSPEDLGRSRLLLREARKGEIAEGLLCAVKAGLDCPPEAMPRVEGEAKAPANPALADMLRVLLKARSDASGVAAKLIASAADLDHLAAGGRDVPALSGWRRDVFGADALRLCRGEIGLVLRGETVEAVPL